MRTGEQITYIVLDKGNEDIALYLELERVLGPAASRDTATQFPMLTKLKQGLRYEVYGVGSG